MRDRFAGVFGGGGLFGIGYAMGVIDGLRSRGVDMSACSMLGTSAGSWAAAATALDIGFDRFKALDVPRFPNPRAGILAGVARQVFDDKLAPGVWVAACALPGLNRRILWGGDIPLADLVAASSAVPGLLAPHSIRGTSYVDGGVRSAVSADAAPIADTLIVVAPLAGAMFGPFGSLVDRRLAREVSSWRHRGGGKAVVFSPREPTSAIARWPWDLFDRDVAEVAFTLGQQQSRSHHLVLDS